MRHISSIPSALSPSSSVRIRWKKGINLSSGGWRFEPELAALDKDTMSNNWDMEAEAIQVPQAKSDREE